MKTLDWSVALGAFVARCKHCEHTIYVGRQGKWFHLSHGYTFCDDHPEGYLRGPKAEAL